MAVENKYTNADLVANKKAVAAFVHGVEPITIVGMATTAAADDDGSVYRVFKNVNPHYVPVKIDIVTEAITGGTDFDLGLYKPSEGGVAGAEIDKDLLADGLDLSSASTRVAPLDGLKTVDISNGQKALYELAGDSLGSLELGYDIALTANTVGSGVGDILVIGTFVYKG